MKLLTFISSIKIWC